MANELAAEQQAREGLARELDMLAERSDEECAALHAQLAAQRRMLEEISAGSHSPKALERSDAAVWASHATALDEAHEAAAEERRAAARRHGTCGGALEAT